MPSSKAKNKALKRKGMGQRGVAKEEVSTAVNAPSKIYGLTQDGNDLGCEFTTHLFLGFSCRSTLWCG